MHRACEDCNLWSRLEASMAERQASLEQTGTPLVAKGECRFHPPEIITVPVAGPNGQPVLSVQSIWPVTEANSWCGGFEPHIDDDLS